MIVSSADYEPSFTFSAHFFCPEITLTESISFMHIIFYFSGSSSVNVSVTSGKEFLNEGQLSTSSSTREMLFELLPTGIMGLLLHLLA
jgi:hypothetical protein